MPLPLDNTNFHTLRPERRSRTQLKNGDQELALKLRKALEGKLPLKPADT